MIDLYKVGINPYDDVEISITELITFAEHHVALVTAAF
jgi:hypothetical protein